MIKRNKKPLTIELIKQEAKSFAEKESKHSEPSLYGVTDGKAVGTYLEHKFQKRLQTHYHYKTGSSAKGIDFPELKVDIKVTSIRQPQSSCPFSSARQKVFGLGYSLLVFVYYKTDNKKERTTNLAIKHVIFIDESRTADFQLTTEIRRIIENSGNADDIVACLTDRFLPIDEIQALKLAKEILHSQPQTGYLTISNALQWRLQYKRVIEKAGLISGLYKIV